MGCATGEEGALSYFYDESEKKLYAAPRDTIPPDDGIGGAPGDGVRAVVVACRGERDNPDKRRIAYLETYAPELKKIMGEIRAARIARRRYEGKMPKGDSPFVLRSTLVRRENESEWHDMSTPEGQRIVAEWQSWTCPDGHPPVVCMP